jgi:hypothetical protein
MSFEQKLEVTSMDSKAALPSREQPTGKGPYSSPSLVDLGSIEEFALGGVGSVIEMAQMTNLMKHP